MILILFLHVTDVFAMLLEQRQPTTDPQTEATFESYEGEPVFADPQHNQYGLKNFWWEQSTAKWEPWWDKLNMTTRNPDSSTKEDVTENWRNLNSSTKEDVTENWKKGLIDKTTTKNIDTNSTTDTLPVSYTTEGTFSTTTAGSIFLTEISSESSDTPTAGAIILTGITRGTFTTPTDSIFLDKSKTLTTTFDGPIFLTTNEENKPEQGQSQTQSALRATTHDYLLELLTASSLRFPQQNAAQLIALRAGIDPRSTMMSHPKESDEKVPLDSDLYRQLGVDITPSLREPDADFSREPPIFLKSPNDKKIKKEPKKDIGKGKKPPGLPGWRLQYAARTTPVTKTSVEFPVLKDLIEIYSGESFPSEKYPDHKSTPNSSEKLIGRSASPSKIAAPYQTSINDADYYEMINSDLFSKPVHSSKSDTTTINEEFDEWHIAMNQPPSPHDLQTITMSIADPDYYDYEKMGAAEHIQTSLHTINPRTLLIIQDNLGLKDPNEQNSKDDPDVQEIVPLKEEHTKVSIPYSSTVNVPQTFAIEEMSIRPESRSPLSVKAAFTAGPAPTAKIPEGLHENQNEVYDLQLPDLLGKPGPSLHFDSPGHVREGTTEDTTTDQSIASATNSDPGTQTIASATSQETAMSISQGTNVKSEKLVTMPVDVAVRPTFTVPNMETTVATTLPPTTTTTRETTQFTLEMAPRPLPNNLPHYDIDWSQFNLAVTTTALPRLLHGLDVPGDTVLTTPHPMVVEMRTEMVEQRIGYFSVFMRKLLDIVSKKDEDALAALLKASSSSLDRLNEYNVLMGLGRPMWPGIQIIFYYMRLMPLDTIKNQAMLGHMYYKSGAIFNDDEKLRELDNELNAVYQVKEGENLMKTLIPFEAFPGQYGEFNADKVMEDIFRAMLAPWFRSKNSDTMYSLLSNLNERFEIMEKRYFGGRRKNLQNKYTTNRGNSIDNKKPYFDSKSKRTEDDSYYIDTSEETIDNIIEHEDEIIKTRSTNDKIRYSTKYKGTKTTTKYNNFHNGGNVKQKPTIKYQKSYNEKSTKITKYVHDELLKDMIKYNTLNSKENTRKTRLFVKKHENYNTDTNKNISKIANVYDKDKLKKRINHDGISKTNRFILQNKESNSHDKKETTRRNDNFNDRPTKQINDYDTYYDDKYSKLIDDSVNVMKTSQKSALSNEKHDDYDTYDDRAKADSREIKSYEYRKKLRKSDKNIKIETKNKNYELNDRTTKKIKDYDSYDDKTKTIITKVIKKNVSLNNEFSKRNDHYDTYDDSSDIKKIRHFRSKDNKRNHNTMDAIINEVRRYKNKQNLEDKNALSSFEQELKDKYQEIESLNKKLENVVKKKPESLIDAKKIESFFKNTKNHGKGKQKLSERVLQKRFEIKRNPDDNKNNSKKNKIWLKHHSSVITVSKIKNHINKNVLVKENIPKGFQKNSHKPANTENKENFWSHLKSRYIVKGADPYLKERFLDFNRDNVQTKKKHSLRNLDKNKNILRVESSYSDEEEVLKSNLQDNLLHGGRNFTDTLHKYKKNNPIRDISSYSDEEDTLKKNIYKTFT